MYPTSFQQSFNSKELCASVVGFPNNSYHSCKSVEEGNRALRAFRGQKAKTPSSSPIVQTSAGPTHPKRSVPPVHPEESWWFCFAGAEPGIYQGV